jgi:hypothetical protein
MAQTTERKSRIPDFASLKEEAEFWDTHSLADFEDDLEPVEIEFARPIRHSYRVPLENDEFHRILALAKRLNIRTSELLHRWVREGLDRDEVDQTGSD